MKKSLATLALILIIANNISLGQSPFNLIQGPDDKGASYTGGTFIGRIGNILYNSTDYNGNGGTNLMEFDINSLKYIKSINALISVAKLTYHFEKFLILKNKLFAFFRLYDRKTKITSLYSEEITNDSAITSSLKKLKDVTSNSKHMPGIITISLSSDSNKLLIADVPPFEDYSGEKIEFKVFDTQLNELNSFSQSIPLINKLDLSDFTLNNDGNIYALVKSYKLKGEKYPIYTGRKEHDNNQTDVKWELLSFNCQNNGTVTEFPITITDKLITDVSYFVDKDKIDITGFYCDDDIYTLTGIFNTILNKANTQIKKNSTVPYNFKLAAGLSDWDLANKVSFTSRGLKIMNRIIFNDGSKVFISEISYQGASYNPHQVSNGITTEWTSGEKNYFHNENIVAIFINPDGTIKSITDIPKLQKFHIGMLNSYILFRKGSDDLLLLFNDNANNTLPQYSSVKDMKAMNNPDKSVVVQVDLNKSGSYKREVLYSGDDDKAAPMIASAFAIGENDFILPRYHIGGFFAASNTMLMRISLK